MLTTSKYIMSGGTTRCSFCKRPFRSRDGYVEFWRAPNGEHFCSEFFADDAEEERFRRSAYGVVFMAYAQSFNPHVSWLQRGQIVPRVEAGSGIGIV